MWFNLQSFSNFYAYNITKSNIKNLKLQQKYSKLSNNYQLKYVLSSEAPPVVERFWQMGGAFLNSRSRLSTQPFGVLRGFLRNLRKYGLRSLRKTPSEAIPPRTSMSHKRRIDLNPKTNQILAFGMQYLHHDLYNSRQ